MYVSALLASIEVNGRRSDYTLLLELKTAMLLIPCIEEDSDLLPWRPSTFLEL